MVSHAGQGHKVGSWPEKYNASLLRPRAWTFLLQIFKAMFRRLLTPPLILLAVL